jgi:undecaprenyl-diphosphatase
LAVIAALSLGLLQGLTEFLPVSSSGHLVLAQWILGVRRPGLSLEIALHGGTLLAVLLALGGRIKSDWRRLLWPLLVASAPAGAAGLLLRPLLERAFEEPLVLGAGWILTGAALTWASRREAAGRPATSLRAREALWIGLCQAVALVPGVSRSGAALVGGLGVGLEAGEAATFAFLLALPSVGGAVLLDLPAWRGEGSLWLGAAVAALAGAAAIRVFLRMGVPRRLGRFGAYCAALGLGTLTGAALRALGLA